ncbi:hypothetical protein COW53_07255 [bacterium CG17_big_fil_post_rev_8_21_14_2_50_64_8]|nr:MAG: hypothetical protein COW53_07255 [bacterium CG17_big_fil_post_rev_8_21_14_2_50_64_8]PJA74403.1 MAG: hypothetical protein CO151_09800 [bacterium CG_4_9_14_3_um_filter_65_15]
MESGHSILILDDDRQDRRIHAGALRGHGYDVRTASGWDEARAAIKVRIPDLILIHASLSRGDAFAMGGKLKDDTSTRSIPVIFTIPARDPATIDRAFAVGAVDTITQPCHLNEFLARIATHIKLRGLVTEVERLRELDIDANPLTHLPGNNTIASTIQEAVTANRDMALVYSDLDNFKTYNDAYGFNAGDDILLFNAETLQTALRMVCTGPWFLGHEGGDDFVVLLPAADVEAFGEKVIRIFDAEAPNFYSSEDRQRGYITTKSRRGDVRKFPLVSISLAGVRLRDYPFTRFVEVAAVCAEVKHAAKAIAGSVLFMDRRGDEKTTAATPAAADLISTQ